MALPLTQTSTILSIPYSTITGRIVLWNQLTCRSKIIPLQSNDDLWLFSSKAVKLGLVNKKTGASRIIAQASLTRAELNGFLFNDAGVDSRGRLWVGIMPDPFDIKSTSGSLWRVDADLSMQEIIGTGLGTPNGLGWSPDEKTFYLNDSVKKAVLAFDYDIESGTVSSQRTLWESEQIGPDGLTVDVVGNIWAALFQQGKVAKVSPNGELLAEVNLPVKTVTDVLFVGEEIFITTAGSGADGSNNVYTCHVGVKGRELYKFPLAANYLGTTGGAV